MANCAMFIALRQTILAYTRDRRWVDYSPCIIIIIIIFIHSESAHAQALASYIVTEFWAGQQDGGPRCCH